MESLFSLRFFLLLIGAAIVAAIYLWGTRSNRRNTRIKYDTRRPRFSPRRRSGAVAHAPSKRSGGRQFEHAEDDTGDDEMDDVVDVVVAGGEDELPLPVITKDGNERPPAAPRRRDDQLELNLDADPPPKRRPAPADETFIALFVRPPAGHEFAGPAIVQAMGAVGLRFGDRQVFHHFGAGDLRTTTPLFSVANMVEPGRFDLRRMEGFSTPGLAMILQLPGPLDGAVAFELFLNTAQRLAEALSGDLYSTPKTLLDSMTIDKMRRDAMPYAQVS